MLSHQKMLSMHLNPEGEKAMMSYEASKKIIADIINSVDFSKNIFEDRDEINFNAFDLTDVPSVDFSEIDSIINDIEKNINTFKTYTNVSRLFYDKKQRVLDAFSDLASRINSYKEEEINGDVIFSKYNKAWNISSKITALSSDVPKSIKNSIVNLHEKLHTALHKVENNVNDRHQFLRALSEKLIEKSYKHQVNNKLKNIESTGLTIEDIRKPNSEEFFDACRNYAFNKFGKGASDTISAIHYQRDKKYPETDWKFNDSIEGCLLCAKNLGVKEIAFVGDSTAALSNLNTIMKLGFSFRIEELTKKRYGEEEIYPAAIVSL